MKVIGGFLELELSAGKGQIYHPRALALSTGRACLSLILKKLKPKKVFVPYYTCDTLLEPLAVQKVRWEYYAVNAAFEPVFTESLRRDEYLIYINYFGIHKYVVNMLIKRYGDRLIVDNTQAFFEKSLRRGWSFNSARKFFGVPDGAYLYSPHRIKSAFDRNKKADLTHLMGRLLEDPKAYQKFVRYERHLDCGIAAISEISEYLLNNIDYQAVLQRRKSNFDFLHGQLAKINELSFRLFSNDVPLCYPLLLDKKINKRHLFKQNIFIPTYWERKKYLRKSFPMINDLADRLLPLPVDQRYQVDDLCRVVDVVRKIVR